MFVHNVCLLEILIDAYGIQYVSTTVHFIYVGGDFQIIWKKKLKDEEGKIESWPSG